MLLTFKSLRKKMCIFMQNSLQKQQLARLWENRCFLSVIIINEKYLEKSSIFSKAVERKFVALLQMISCPGNFQGFFPINFQKKLLLSLVDRGIAWYFVVFEYLVNWQYQVVYFYQKFGHLDISASVSCHQDWQQNFKIFILWFFFKANKKFMSNALQYTYSFACASLSIYCF